MTGVLHLSRTKVSTPHYTDSILSDCNALAYAQSHVFDYTGPDQHRNSRLAAGDVCYPPPAFHSPYDKSSPSHRLRPSSSPLRLRKKSIMFSGKCRCKPDVFRRCGFDSNQAAALPLSLTDGPTEKSDVFELFIFETAARIRPS